MMQSLVRSYEPSIQIRKDENQNFVGPRTVANPDAINHEIHSRCDEWQSGKQVRLSSAPELAILRLPCPCSHKSSHARRLMVTFFLQKLGIFLLNDDDLIIIDYMIGNRFLEA